MNAVTVVGRYLSADARHPITEGIITMTPPVVLPQMFEIKAVTPSWNEDGIVSFAVYSGTTPLVYTYTEKLATGSRTLSLTIPANATGELFVGDLTGWTAPTKCAVTRYPILDPTNSGLLYHRWLAIGASETEGQGASARSKRWSDLAVSQLRKSAGLTGGPGHLPAYGHVYGPDSTWGSWLTSSTGSVSQNDFESFGYAMLGIPTGATATYTITGTSIDLWYWTHSSVGTFTVTIDGKLAATINSNVLAANEADAHVWLPLGPSRPHTVTITGTDASLPAGLLGFTVYDGDEHTGNLTCWNAGRTSWGSYEYLSQGSWAKLTASLPNLGIDLVTLSLGANDFLHNTATPAQLQANLISMTDNLRSALGTPKIIMLVLPTNAPSGATPVGGQTATWADYRSAQLAAAAARSLPTWCPWDATSQFASDGLHWSDAGHRAVAASFAAYLPTA